jgi:hypothetical protein
VFFAAGSAWLARHPCGVAPAGGGAASPAADTLPPGDAGARVDTNVPAPRVLDELAGALASARGGLANFLDLLSFEARRAGLALMWMVAWGFVAAICVVAAWLGLMAALALWAVSLGLAPIAAVLAIAVLNCVAAGGLFYMCIGMSHDLLFSATRRQVAGKSPVKPPSP